MRLVPALVISYFTAVTGGPKEPAAAPLASGMTRPAIVEIDQALGFGLAAKAPEYDAALDTPRRHVTSNGRVIALPNGCRTVSHPYDLLIHFHGAPTAVEPAFERAEIEGALAILNLGIGSGKYDAEFQFGGSFDGLLTRLNVVIHDLCPTAVTAPRRIALSGWSAGYGAVFRILDRPKDAARIDAVLLADGLHAGIEAGEPGERRVGVEQMAPFVGFADEAVAGHKLFALTHSAIGTTYASTTETADYLLAQEGVERTTPTARSFRPGMTLRSRADSGGFHVLGFGGGNEAAHCDHLHAFGETLLPYLKERWSVPPPGSFSSGS
ncbi:MAG TPA: hypothetical protein VGK73_32885 [Polyangiaceae bacterium]